MIYDNLLRDPLYWIIPWVLQSAGYYTVLGKMGLSRSFCFIPFLAEWRFSKVMFKRMRSFYRPFTIALIFAAGAYYLGPGESAGIAYLLIAGIVYGVFLIRLYYRISRCFGHGVPFTIGFAFCPTLFLLILGLGSSEYLGPPQFKPDRIQSKPLRVFLNVLFGLASAAEIIALAAVVGMITVQMLPPRTLVNSLLDDTYSKTKDITSNGECITRTDTMGSDAADLAGIKPSREYYFPDHSQDRNVVVMEYVIGSNLENKTGLASANISMMKDATKKGDALTFVLQAGGSERWFTGEIDDASYGRYTIAGGDLEQAMELDNTKSMSDPEQLEEFIRWTKDNYPADRYMLILWDHGGGLALGYGQDDLNSRQDADNEYGTIRVSEIAEAVKNAGVRFDMIGFDACLMQDIEIAKALEPYADYYLASEEVEGGYGWFYTDAFGKLAQDPGRGTEEIGTDIVSAYDSFNTILNDGEKDTNATLSLVDLTLVKPAYSRLSRLFAKAKENIRDNSEDFAEISLAASNAYAFRDDFQIDLEDFIGKLSDTDIDGSILSDKEKTDLLNAARACVVCRNRDSAKGVNGLAFAFPYNSIEMYGATDRELGRLSLRKQKAFSEDVFSIIASQMKKEHEAKMKELDEEDNRLQKFLEEISYVDYTGEDWYEEGFEDYVPASALVDIPLREIGTTGEYQVELPEKTWNIVADCRTMVYQMTEDGEMRYLGADYLGGTDPEGHPAVSADDYWVQIGGQLVCYEGKPVKETDAGDISNGTVRAKLNGKDEILLYIEWSAAAGDGDDGAETAAEGRVIGYEYTDDEDAALSKGLEKLNSGDSLEFLFDYYDEEGNLRGTEVYGDKVRVNRMDRITVTDAPLGSCDIRFLGILTDAYQRTIMTEVIEAHVGDE